MRMRQTHDLWHVMTGIGTDRIGELALKAFELAQTRRPLAAVITTGGVIRFLMKDPEHLTNVLAGISIGYRLGNTAKPFLAQKWEEGWERPLEDWRRELNVDPAAHIAGSGASTLPMEGALPPEPETENEAGAGA